MKKNYSHLDKIIKDLQSSPLFYLFLGSRELFHTNFWYWLSTINKVETIKIFNKNAVGSLEETSFTREHRQSANKESAVVDLFISDSSDLNIIIENKIKDFPTVEQLNRIQQSSLHSNTQFILVTLFSYKELNFNKWKILTYKELAENIAPEKIVNGSSVNFNQKEYYQSLIGDYKNFTLNLSLLAKELPITNVYDFAIAFDKGLYEKLNQINLWESYQKMRGSHIINTFNNTNHNNEAQTNYSINHQKATLDFFTKDIDGYTFGISIENNQFRKIIYGENVEKIGRILAEREIFFTQKFHSRENLFCRYGTEYRYQYSLIEEIGFDELFQKIHTELHYIYENKEIIRKLIRENT